MPKIKSHKTVEQIAKKHRLDVSFIQKQLDMGEPIEHEHTKDHELAMDIALQHLDEIPDYYTRLKKMEASAKKEHKKFKDVKEDAGDGVDDMDSPVHMPPMNGVHVDHEKRYCTKCKKVELRSECKYGPKYWDLFSLPEKLKEETKSGDESLHDWFKKSSGKDPKTGKRVSGWVQLGGPFAGAPCARQEGQTSTPKCGSSKMAANLSDKEEEKAFRRKNRKDSNQPEKKNAAKPTNVRTEEMDLQEKKKSSKKDACYHKVKSRYDVWPSAYASGALVKCRKVGAANWGTKSEETMHEEQRYCPLCDKRETRSECSYGGKAWDKVSIKDHEYSMARSELSTIEDAVKRLKAKVGKGEGDLEAWVQSKITKAADYIDTAADYIASGEMDEELKIKTSTGILKGSQSQVKRSAGGASGLTPDAAKQLGPKAQQLQKKAASKVDIPRFEEKLVDKITNEIINEKCWTGYKKKGMKTMFGKKYPNCVKAEDVTIEDANGNTFAEVVDIIKPEPIKGFKSQVTEAIRLQAQTGNVIGVTLNWRGKYYSLKMFFPQVKLPTRKEITDELQKVYPGCNVVYHSISEIQPGQPLIQPGVQGGSFGHPGSNMKYVKPCGEQVEFDEKYVPWDFGPKQKAKAKFEKLSQRKKEEVSTGVRGGKGTATRANRIAAVGREMRITLDKDSAATGTDPKRQGLQPSTERHTAAAKRGAGGGTTARKLYAQFEAEGEFLEDWQKVNRQDKTDGLSPAAVKAYRRENPGSNLQTAVTEKKPKGKRAKRRASFCRRMKGMKSKLTSAETARDPDSRINKALRRWNCN